MAGILVHGNLVTLEDTKRNFLVRGVTRCFGYRRSRFVPAALGFGFLLIFLLELSHASETVRDVGTKKPIIPKDNCTVGCETLTPADEDDGAGNRIGVTCSADDIAIYEGATNPLPDGIPTYTVEIVNVCVSGCSISDIHVTCEWFSSARLVNPKVFRRLCYNDCLVNDGEALGPGQSLTFLYANSFRYPLSISSVTCH